MEVLRLPFFSFAFLQVSAWDVSPSHKLYARICLSLLAVGAMILDSSWGGIVALETMAKIAFNKVSVVSIDSPP
jgi:hypothetical protein